MTPSENILNIGAQMLLNAKYLSSELLRFCRGSDFYYWRISTEDGSVGFPLSILFYGRESIADDVIAAFFSNKAFIKTRLLQCPPIRASQTLLTLKEKRDALVIRERPFCKRGNGGKQILFQSLLDTSIAIKDRESSELMEQDIGKATRRKLLHCVERCSCQIRKTNDHDEILHFYRSFVIPTAQTLHGEQARVPSEDDFKRLAGKLILFLLEEEEKPVAGLLAIHSKRLNSLTMWYLGMKESILKDSNLKCQHHMCLFRSALEMACELKVKSLSHGVTCPILNHGNLNYKVRLSSQPLLIPRYPRCSLEFPWGREAEILSHHPILGVEDEKFYAMIGVAQPLPPDSLEKYFNEYFKRYSFKNLHTIKCFMPKDECDHNTLDRLGEMNFGSYAFLDLQAEKENVILTFQRTT